MENHCSRFYRAPALVGFYLPARPRHHCSYLSRSRAAAESFAERGDGTGTTVWPRSAFGGRSNIGAGVSSKAPAIFRYRIVAKCRVLKGEGVKKARRGRPRMLLNRLLSVPFLHSSSIPPNHYPFSHEFCRRSVTRVPFRRYFTAYILLCLSYLVFRPSTRSMAWETREAIWWCQTTLG